jgi:hypothetical protein
LSRLLLVVYFLEVGIVLIVVPWSVFWERNFFFSAVPGLASILQNNFVRGAVSGLGVVNLLAGFIDLAAMLMGRRSGFSPVGQRGFNP